MKNRVDQLAEARQLGMVVEPVRSTGEMRLRSPLLGGPPITINNRRKDGTRAAESLIEKHRRALGESIDQPR